MPGFTGSRDEPAGFIRKVGDWITGAVAGIKVSGYWTGRGILVQIIHGDGEMILLPMVHWDQRSELTEARFVNGCYIQVGAEYLLDEQANSMQD